jgi:hypothetical protein
MFGKLPTILFAASVGGGLFLTFLSGLYVVKPFILDAEELYFGFPLAWLQADRGLWGGVSPWRYSILWQGLILDFLLYGSIGTLATAYLFRVTLKKEQSIP